MHAESNVGFRIQHGWSPNCCLGIIIASTTHTTSSISLWLVFSVSLYSAAHMWPDKCCSFSGSLLFSPCSLLCCSFSALETLRLLKASRSGPYTYTLFMHLSCLSTSSAHSSFLASIAYLSPDHSKYSSIVHGFIFIKVSSQNVLAASITNPGNYNSLSNGRPASANRGL